MQWTVKRIRGSAVALALSAALLGVTGCSQDDPEPEAENRPTETETSLAAVEDESPEEFIRRWNDVQNEMQKGDTEAWRSLTPDCSACQKTADRVDAAYDAGGYVRTDGRRILTITKSFSRGNNHQYEVEVESSPTTFRLSRDAQEETLEGGKLRLAVSLTHDGTVWVFNDYWQLGS